MRGLMRGFPSASTVVAVGADAVEGLARDGEGLPCPVRKVDARVCLGAMVGGAVDATDIDCRRL